MVTFKSVYINIFGNEIVRPVSERRYLRFIRLMSTVKLIRYELGRLEG